MDIAKRFKPFFFNKLMLIALIPAITGSLVTLIFVPVDFSLQFSIATTFAAIFVLLVVYLTQYEVDFMVIEGDMLTLYYRGFLFGKKELKTLLSEVKVNIHETKIEFFYDGKLTGVIRKPALEKSDSWNDLVKIVRDKFSMGAEQ